MSSRPPASSYLRRFLNYPTPTLHTAPYRAPPADANPVIGGALLYYLAFIVSNVSFICAILWKNAGFAVLRDIKKLNDVSYWFEPIVIPLAADGEDGKVEEYTKPDSLRAPPSVAEASRFWTVKDYHEAFKSGKVTPIEVVEALLPLIRRDVENRSVHSVAFIDSKVELVRAAAEASTKRWKDGKPLGVLDGVPIAVKDEVDVKGYKKTDGSKRDFTNPKDETIWCVSKWEEQGAVLVGKTNMHEIGLDTTNNNPNFGTPRNPYNDQYYTGGSSGGSAYAVAAGLVPFALGCDGGGSIRLPSNFCGIYGLKPSHGRVSFRPGINFAQTNTVIGPMAATMSDLEVAYRVMATPDPEEANSARFAAPARVTSPPPKRLGIYKTWFDRADAHVQKTCREAIDYLTKQHGYEVIEIEIPHIHEGQRAHALTILSEAETAVPSVAGLTAANKLLISVAKRTPARDWLLAQKMRCLLMEHLAFLFQRHPGLLVVTPATPCAGWPIKGGDADLKYGVTDGDMSLRSMEYVWLANFTGAPSMSCPVGYVEPVKGKGNVPVGLMAVGEWGSEDALIEWGFDVEKWVHEGLSGGRNRPSQWVDVLGECGKKN